MDLWTSGKILELLHETETIQKDLRLPNTPSTVAEISKNLLVKRAAVKTRGGAGPSGLDGYGWSRVLITKQFGNSFTDLCEAMNCR